MLRTKWLPYKQAYKRFSIKSFEGQDDYGSMNEVLTRRFTHYVEEKETGKKSFQEGMATSTDVIDAETMLSKVQIAFLLAYYKYDVALASLLSTCGMPESFWQYSRTGQTENFIFGK